MPFWPLFRKREYFVYNVLPRLPGLECLYGKILIPVPEISVTGSVWLLIWAVGKVIRREELRGEISKTKPTRLTGLAPWDWIVREFRETQGELTGNSRDHRGVPTKYARVILHAYLMATVHYRMHGRWRADAARNGKARYMDEPAVKCSSKRKGTYSGNTGRIDWSTLRELKGEEGAK